MRGAGENFCAAGARPLSIDGIGSVEIFVQGANADRARDLIARAERGELAVPETDFDPTSSNGDAS